MLYLPFDHRHRIKPGIASSGWLTHSFIDKKLMEVLVLILHLPIEKQEEIPLQN